MQRLKKEREPLPKILQDNIFASLSFINGTGVVFESLLNHHGAFYTGNYLSSSRSEEEEEDTNLQTANSAAYSCRLVTTQI